MKKSCGAKTLIHPTPVWVAGTYDAEGNLNVMTVAWAGICCSKPPCVAISLRSATHTHAALVARKAFTLGVPSERHAAEVDFFGVASGKAVDKFATTGLTAVRSELVDAPYVEEFPLVLECKVIQIVEIGLHTQFIGEILDVKADETALSEKGLPDIEKIRPILFATDSYQYYGIGERLGKAFEIGKKW